METAAFRVEIEGIRGKRVQNRSMFIFVMKENGINWFFKEGVWDWIWGSGSKIISQKQLLA